MLQMMELVQEEHSKTRDLGYICSIRLKMNENSAEQRKPSENERQTYRMI